MFGEGKGSAVGNEIVDMADDGSARIEHGFEVHFFQGVGGLVDGVLGELGQVVGSGGVVDCFSCVVECFEGGLEGGAVGESELAVACGGDGAVEVFVDHVADAAGGVADGVGEVGVVDLDEAVVCEVCVVCAEWALGGEEPAHGVE